MVQTGIPFLDQPGLKGGDKIRILGAAGSGKTHVATRIIAGLLRNTAQPVRVCSLEHTGGFWRKRLLHEGVPDPSWVSFSTGISSATPKDWHLVVDGHVFWTAGYQLPSDALFVDLQQPSRYEAQLLELEGWIPEDNLMRHASDVDFVYALRVEAREIVRLWSRGTRPPCGESAPIWEG